MVMNAYVVIVLEGDGPELEGESVLMKVDTVSVVHWVQQCYGENDAVRTGRIMRLVGVLEDRRGWFFQTCRRGSKYAG